MSNARRDLFLKAMLVWLSLAACKADRIPEPFPDPIPATAGSIEVNIVEFTSLPDFNGEPASMMLLVDEPGTGRLFVNDLFGILYSVSYDGRTVVPYLDLNASQWGIEVLRNNILSPPPYLRRGFSSFAFHPQFAEAGTRGFGRFYTLVETGNTEPAATFALNSNESRHHLLLLEWTTRDPSAAFYDGGPPRELMRIEQVYKLHASGMIGFNPCASSGDADFGLLYLSMGDGNVRTTSQDLSNVGGKILRIDPLGSNSTNGQYGIPSDNPFVADNGALGEIYAYGLRHPQRFGWDVRNGDLFVVDIGSNYVEEVNLVPAGANLGWPNWEGSFEWVDSWRGYRVIVRLAKKTVRAIREGYFRIWLSYDDFHVFSLDNPRSDARITYPVVEFDRWDSLLQEWATAITGVVVYRHDAIPQLENAVLFGELVSGEVFYFSADDLPEGGQEAIRRVRFKHRGKTKTLLQMIQEKNIVQGREPTVRADMRFGTGPDGQIFSINKRDGIIRRLLP